MSRVSSKDSPPPESPDLSPVEQLWDMVEQETLIVEVQHTEVEHVGDEPETLRQKLLHS